MVLKAVPMHEKYMPALVGSPDDEGRKWVIERGSKSEASSLKAEAMPLDIMWHRITSVCEHLL